MLDLDAIDRMEPATGGAATSVWRIHARSSRYALRVFRAHERHVLQRELLAMQCAHAGGVPVPRVLAVGTYDARPSLLTEWCRGEPILNLLQHRRTFALQLGWAFGRLHAALHALAAPAALRRDWIDWPVAAEPALAARLRVVSSATDRLIHLDYHPLNVLAIHTRPSAVLDWTNAHAGDPRADVARTLSILRLMPHVLKLPPGARLGGRVFEVAWRAGYGRFGNDLAPFHAWAGGAMLHDLSARYTASDLTPVRDWTHTWRRRAGLPSLAD